MNQHTRIRRHTATAILAGAALLPLAACQAGAAQVSAASAATAQPGTTSTSAASTSAVSANTVSASVPPVGVGTGGPGSLTVDITSPVAVSGHVDTPVSCETAGRRYVASATGTIRGYTVADTVRIANYHGPATYPAVVTVSVSSSAEGKYAIDAVPATAVITSAGGSVSFTAQTSAGRTLAGSIVWSCSA